MWRRTFAWSLLAAIALSGCYASRVDLQRNYHPSDADLSVTRIAHGSLIIEMAGERLLVDPWYSPSLGLGHAETIGIAVERLPSVTALVLTRGSSDHFDPKTLKRFAKGRPAVLVPAGLARSVLEIGFETVTEFDDWEVAQVGEVRVIAVPAAGGQPNAGFVLQAREITLYIAGSTQFEPKLFWSIAESFPEIDVAILPIGGNRWLGISTDLTPEQATRAIGILKPKRVIPYHFGLVGMLPLLIRPAEPMNDFNEILLQQFPAFSDTVVALAPGESWHHYR